MYLRRTWCRAWAWPWACPVAPARASGSSGSPRPWHSPEMLASPPSCRVQNIYIFWLYFCNVGEHCSVRILQFSSRNNEDKVCFKILWLQPHLLMSTASSLQKYGHTVPKTQNIYSQKWKLRGLIPNFFFMHLWTIYKLYIYFIYIYFIHCDETMLLMKTWDCNRTFLLPWTFAEAPGEEPREYVNRSQIHKWGNWETEHNSSVLE